MPIVNRRKARDEFTRVDCFGAFLSFTQQTKAEELVPAVIVASRAAAPPVKVTVKRRDTDLFGNEELSTRELCSN